MFIARTISELIKQRKLLNGRVAFVPTMGNLHQGHLSLIDVAKKNAEHVIVSIFVNPLQFGPKEDFASYPRTVEQDIKLLEPYNIDILFLPTEAELFPQGREHLTFVTVPTLSDFLDGRRHDKYFSGIATIVSKYFLLCQPHIAFFGQKDYQQFLVIKKCVQDLNFQLEVQVVPTVREKDGLAMSSRNNKLTPEDRKIAPLLYQSLLRVKANFSHEKISEIIDEEKKVLINAGFSVDYFEVRAREDLSEKIDEPVDLIVLVAVYLGGIRLIDNLKINYEKA